MSQARTSKHVLIRHVAARAGSLLCGRACQSLTPNLSSTSHVSSTLKVVSSKKSSLYYHRIT